MILNTVKKLLQIKNNDPELDSFISTIIDLTLAKVKSLCNIDDDCTETLDNPDFKLLIAQIAADIYTCYEPKSNESEEADDEQSMPKGQIKSITISDYKVEYNTPSTSYQTHSLSDSITYNLDKYDEELARYRYLIFY